MPRALLEWLHFRLPASNVRRTEEEFQSGWQRWTEQANVDSLDSSLDHLGRNIIAALMPEIRSVAFTLTIHGVASFSAAILLKELVTELLSGSSDASGFVIVLALLILLTATAWVSLNHIFKMSDILGIAARSYVERRLVFSIGGRVPQQDDAKMMLSLFDRECGRVEQAWSGFVMIALASITLVVTVTYFLFILKLSAFAVFAVITFFGLLIYLTTHKLATLYKNISNYSKHRVKSAEFIVKNRLAILLNNWKEDCLQSHDLCRQDEEGVLKSTARFVALINLATTVAPPLSLLAAIVMHVWLYEGQDTGAIVAAIALVGSLRSVANGVPAGIQNLIMGKVAHQTIESFLVTPRAGPGVRPDAPCVGYARHVAIIGTTGSDRSDVLLTTAREHAAPSVYVPIEPWIFTGTLMDNVTLYNNNATINEIARTLNLVSLSSGLFVDEHKKIEY